MVSQNDTTVTKRPSIKELKKKYENQSNNNLAPRTSKAKSPQMQKKFQVKQMANLFNSKARQIVETESSPKGGNALGSVKFPQGKGLGKQNTLPKALSLPRTTEKVPPVASPRSKSLARMQRKPSCFVAEDAFAQMSVKDKAMLYTQFVNDMTKKNPKFGEHVEALEANLKKEVARGEMINEKQESVKNLLANLEARCMFPKQTISPAAEEILNSVGQPKIKKVSESTWKAKEFEDLEKPKPASHISTLTITLQSVSPAKGKRGRRSHSLPRGRCMDNSMQLVDLNLSEPCHKRNSDKMRTTLSIEAYAPPKKIRRTRAEHLAPPHVFQNQHLETLFYSWLKERHEESQKGDRTEDNEKEEEEAADDQENQKSAVDKLLEEAIAKLETVKIKQKQDKLREEKQEPATPEAKETKATKSAMKPLLSSECSTTSSAKHTDGEDEERVKLHPEGTQAKPQDSEVFVRPLKPARKKKMRRSLNWRKDASLVETNVISSTDSETENQGGNENRLNKMVPNVKMQNNEMQTENRQNQVAPNVKMPNNEILGERFHKKVAPNGIRAEMAPNGIQVEHRHNQVAPNGKMQTDAFGAENHLSKVAPNVNMESTEEQYLESNLSMTINAGQNSNDICQNPKKSPDLPTSMTDSFDQGFETGSNDVESPIRPARKPLSQRRQERTSTAPLFVKLGSEKEKPLGFSTPVRGPSNVTPAFNESSGARQQIFSPIGKQQRRNSFYDSESRRSSLAMQVIREDHPLEHHEIQSPRCLSSSQMFFAEEQQEEEKINSNSNLSKFWINCGDYALALEIHPQQKERIQLLYEIFSQRSCDTKDLHFGIDGYRFSVHDASVGSGQEDVEILKRLPRQENCSQYWFATGDLAIPFAGKPLSSKKIQRLFDFIKSSVEETGVLRFGIDHMEFSNVPEFWSQSPKFSMESSYSILVGLQSGTSNGLEGRSKYAWPNSKPMPVSDLDQSDFESDIFDNEETEESGRLSLSPFGSNHFDLASLGAEDLLMPRNSDVMRLSSGSFGKDYENESLDQLFEERPKQELEHGEKLATRDSAVPEMLSMLKNQHERFSAVKERLNNYHSPKSYQMLV
uniref:Uncharacterized protein n=1 Tax=Musca domestica TaxID=7370 RepID=A0A1I8MMS8_MUSDO